MADSVTIQNPDARSEGWSPISGAEFRALLQQLEDAVIGECARAFLRVDGAQETFALVKDAPSLRLLRMGMVDGSPLRDSTITIERGEVVVESWPVARQLAALIVREDDLPAPRFDTSRIARALADLVLRQERS